MAQKLVTTTPQGLPQVKLPVVAPKIVLPRVPVVAPVPVVLPKVITPQAPKLPAPSYVPPPAPFTPSTPVIAPPTIPLAPAPLIPSHPVLPPVTMPFSPVVNSPVLPDQPTDTMALPILGALITGGAKLIGNIIQNAKAKKAAKAAAAAAPVAQQNLFPDVTVPLFSPPSSGFVPPGIQGVVPGQGAGTQTQAKPWYMMPATWAIGGGGLLLFLLFLFFTKRR